MDKYKRILTTTVQSIQATVLIGIGLVHLAVDLEGRVHDSVGVASGHTTQVVVLLVDAVVAGIVEAKDNVTNLAVDVLDEEVADGSSVGDEVGLDTLARDGVLAVLVDAGAIASDLRLGEGEEREGRESSEMGEHCRGVERLGRCRGVCAGVVVLSVGGCRQTRTSPGFCSDQRCELRTATIKHARVVEVTDLSRFKADEGQCARSLEGSPST
jgi:hypothetical protein